jgi:hypothetical protein
MNAFVDDAPTSQSKVDAARRNGLLGGRPKQTVYCPDDVTNWKMVCAELRANRVVLEKLEQAVDAFAPGAEIAPNDIVAGRRRVNVVKSIIANRFKLDQTELFSKARPSYLVWPRHLAMALASEFSGLGNREVGDMFHINHTMVSYAVQKVKDQSETDPKRRVVVDELRKELAVRFKTICHAS